MTHTLDTTAALALSLLLGQHGSEQAALDAASKVTVLVTRSPNPPAKIKAKKEIVTDSKPGVPGLAMGERGTLDAAAFIAAVKVAGSRMGEADPISGRSMPYTDAGCVRNDLICAIHGYVGYDPTGNFGAQETAARAKAMRDLRINVVHAGKERAIVKSAAASLHGFVAGLPDHAARQLADLRGQAVKEAEALAAFITLGDKVGERTQDERLAHIHWMIGQMGYES